jgi:uncharacterized membrane protein
MGAGKGSAGTSVIGRRLTGISLSLVRPRITVAMLVALALGLSLGSGAILKGVCTGPAAASWRSRLCYNDIQPLYAGRGIDRHVFPYIHATLAGTAGAHGFNEYPVLTGLFMWASGWAASDSSSYLVVTVILLATCAVAAAWALWRMAGVRAIYWTASPVLVLYAFHNWDLLAVTAAVAGLYLWWSGRPLGAAFAFAVGGGFKLYPALFIVPLVCDRLVRRRPSEAMGVAAVGGGTLIAINLPFILINASGWWATYRFHAQRPPTSSGTIWAVLDRSVSTATENLLSFSALALTLAAITVWLFRARPATGYPVVEWCAAATAAFVVLNKVSSPQFVLWIVPFLVVLRLGPVWWWLLSAIACLRYAALFGVDVFPVGLQTADRLVRAAVILQAAVLVAYMAAVLIRARVLGCGGSSAAT